MPDLLWGRGEGRISLDSHTLHLWQVPIDHINPQAAACLLSQDEQTRAARLLIPQVRQRFIQCRGALRMILSRYLEGIPPTALRFVYGPHGKPTLDSHPDVQFNLSHSEDRALVVVAKNRAVGVDIERIRTLPHLRTMAETTFAPGECAALFALPALSQITAFFTLWTRKEAFMKALGDGFRLSPLDFEVSLDEPPRLLRLKGSEAGVDQWHFRTLKAADGFAAAVVAEGHDWHLEEGMVS